MQTVALQPHHRTAPRRLLNELTLQVYSDLPFGTNPAPASVAEGLGYTALAAKLSGERAASVELHAVALRRLLEEQGADAWIYRFGLAGFIHAGVLALSEQGPIYLDAFTGLVSPEPIWALLDKLSQGKTVDPTPLGRARKTCCIDPAHASAAMVETIALNAERELVGDSQRVFSIAWRPELYMATQPEAQEAMSILGRLGVPRSFLQLLLYPISVQADEKVSVWLEEMPLIGGWFAGEDLPKGKDLPPHRLASRDRIALATTLVEQTRARLDFKEMQERSDLAVQAREELARIQAVADLEQNLTSEWRGRAMAAEAALAEIREQVIGLADARAVALEAAHRLEQDKSEWRDRAVAAETALAEVREQVAQLGEARALALETAHRLEQDKTELLDRAVAAETALVDVREQAKQLGDAKAVALEAAHRLEQDKSEWRDRAVAAETALAEVREQVAQLGEARALALETAHRLEQDKTELLDRAVAAETALVDVREQAKQLGDARAVALEAAHRSEQDKSEWRDRAVAAETALAEVREQVAQLGEARALALETAHRLEQDKTELLDRAVAAETALVDVREQAKQLGDAKAVALEAAHRLEQDKSEWRERALAADAALADLREQITRFSEARTVALEEAYRSEQGKAEWRERATSAETALAEVRAELDRLSREETAARDEARRLQQRVSQLRAEVEESEGARAAEAARADALQVRAGAAEQSIAELSRELKLTRGRAVQALAAAAKEASVLTERLLDADTRLATAVVQFNALREASEAEAARWKEDIAASLQRVEEARSVVAKERQAREEAEWRIHDSQRSIQRLQTELAQERGGRELDLRRVEEGRRLAFEAQRRLEREAETLRAALLKAPQSRPTPYKPPLPVELAQTSRVDQELVERLQAEIAAVASERDTVKAALDVAQGALDAQSDIVAELAIVSKERNAALAALDTAQSALEAQNAILARSRYMRLRSRLIKLLSRGAAPMSQLHASKD